MDLKKLYLSTIDPHAGTTAQKYGLGLELAQFATAWNLDERFAETDAEVCGLLSMTDRVVLHAPFNELFPCAIDPMARELARTRYRQTLEMALRYGAEKVVIHGGYHPLIYYPVWYVEQSIRFWKEFEREIPDGLTVCLENVFEEEPMMLPEIVRAVDSRRLRLCLDVGHVNAYSPSSVFDWMEQWAPYLSHFHIHNNDGSRDSHSPLYEGTIPMELLLNRAMVLCPEATFTLELTEAEPSVRWLLEVLK